MRIFFAVALVVVGMCVEAVAALPPYVRNPLTTNPITIGASMSIAGDVLEAVGGGSVTPSSMFLRTTNRWFDGVLASFYTNAFVANSGGVSNIIATNLPIGSITRLEFVIDPGVAIGFPGTTAAQWGGLFPFFSTNAGIWNIVTVSVPNAGVTNYRHSLEGSFSLSPGANVTFTTNFVTGVIEVSSSGGGGTNTLEYTQAISGTNFIIDVRALGATNTVRIVQTGHAGLIWTNVPPNKERLVLKVWNSSAGFSLLITNGADNTRFTGPQTGLTRSTNGGWLDTFVFYSDGTNMVLGGQNWGARP